jgi:hypothetical protein
MNDLQSDLSLSVVILRIILAGINTVVSAFALWGGFLLLSSKWAED